MTYCEPARIALRGLSIASLALACFGFCCITGKIASAAPATSEWTTRATPERPGAAPNPILCQSFEKGIRERLVTMRTLRYGSAKQPPLLPKDLTDWHQKTQMDPDAAKKYEAEEAMVRRLNGYMIDNGCQPVDIDAELGQGVVKPKAEKR